MPSSSDGIETLNERVFTENADQNDHLEASYRRSEDKSLGLFNLWNNERDLLSHCIGFSIGIGNLWRFPCTTYSLGGGAFLLPYLIISVIIGFPLYYMELFLGQFTQLDPIDVWEFCPFFKGIGYSVAINCAVIAIYYNVILMYGLFYLIQSFKSPLPFGDCYSWWGADSNCYRSTSNIPSCKADPENQNCVNATHVSSDQFWKKYVLELSPGLQHPEGIRWELAVLLLAVWTIMFLLVMERHYIHDFCTKFNLRTQCFTVFFPIVVLSVFFLYGINQSNAMDELQKLFVPKWWTLLNVELWSEAAQQSVFSLGLAQGGLIIFGAKSRSFYNVKRCAAFSFLADTLAALMAAMITFMIAGMLDKSSSLLYGEENLSGIGLVFITYPEALNKMSFPNLWGICFFLMFFVLGLDSSIAMLQTVLIGTKKMLPFAGKRPELLLFITCFVLYSIGLSCVTKGGFYVLNMFDTYATSALLAITAVEAIAFGWGYGINQLSIDVKRISGRNISLFLKICWVAVAPIATTVLFSFTLSMYRQLKAIYLVPYPSYTCIIGWTLVALCLAPIPVYMVISVLENRPSLKKAFKPSENWFNAVSRQELCTTSK